MRRECDIGNLFSKDTTDISRQIFVLEENGIRITDEKGSIKITSDVISVMNKAISGMGIRTRELTDAFDAIIKFVLNEPQNQVEDSEELDKFLSGFVIRDTKQEVS